MKRLLLLRHVKSSWKERSLTDFDRPLNKRGRTAAGLMAKYMEAEELFPDLILCSASLRTRETLMLLVTAIAKHSDIRIEESLYHASPGQILKEIATADPNHETVMVIGHNPGLDELARSLALRGNLVARRRLKEKFPTGALAVIDSLGNGWSSLSDTETRLERFVRPKDLYPALAAAPCPSVSHN